MISTTKSYNTFILLLILLFTSKFFQSTPFESLFFQIQIIFLVLILIFIAFYLLNIFNKHLVINKIMIYFLLLILIIPIYSSFRANIEFGQPYYYGILSQRDWLLIGSGVFIYYKLINNRISFNQIEKSFLIMTWVSLIFFTFIVLTFDASQLSKDSKFVFDTADRGLRFKFQNFFITFGAIYYFIKFNTHKKKIDLLILLLFFAYILFIIQGRTYILILAFTFLLYYIFNYPINKIVMIFFKILIFIISGILIIQMIAPDYLDRMSNLFLEMFKVLSGEESKDNSSNARIWTSLIVMNYFETSDLSLYFGTGRISQQWNNGYERLFGYFYPEDIGLLGGVFLYGLFGILMLVIIPYYWIIREIRTLKKNNTYVFIQAVKYMLVLSIIRLLQGGLYFGPDIWLVLFFILYAYNQTRGAINDQQ
jgi:hypothetical protein